MKIDYTYIYCVPIYILISQHASSVLVMSVMSVILGSLDVCLHRTVLAIHKIETSTGLSKNNHF